MTASIWAHHQQANLFSLNAVADIMIQVTSCSTALHTTRSAQRPLVAGDGPGYCLCKYRLRDKCLTSVIHKSCCLFYCYNTVAHGARGLEISGNCLIAHRTQLQYMSDC
jgi:hypothetical protein